jgi:hypothetical protein
VKAIVKLVVAIVVALVAIVVLIGPGRVVAGTEYPFGVGPWSSTGRYCHVIYTMTHFVDEWKHSDHTTLSSSQKVTWLAFEKTLTTTGPHVPRADFTAWYRTTGNVAKRMANESSLINTWWNHNCTSFMMEVPASANRIWSGVDAHETFVHYSKNVIDVANFSRVIS